MQKILLFLLLLCAVILYSFNLSHSLIFFGDAGWYFLDARDILLGERIPLVGLPTSHPWLHQGSGWTYLLSIALFLGNFHPVSGGYLAALIGVLTVFSLYYVGSKAVSYKTGVFASFLFLTSPLATFYMRLPFHTTPLPLLSIWYFYFLSEWVKGRKNAWYILLGVLAIAYQFEVATAIFLGVPFVLIFLFGVINNKIYVTFLKEGGRELWIKSIGILSFFLLPILIYDLQHGFPQTIRYGVWFVYRFLSTFHIIPRLYSSSEQSLSDFTYFTYDYIQKIFLYNQKELALGIALFLFGSFFWILKRQWERKERNTTLLLLYFLTLFTSGIYLVYRNASEGFIHILLPFLFLSLGYVASQFTRKTAVTYLIVLGIGIYNLYHIIGTNFLTASEEKNSVILSEQEQIVKQMLKDAQGKQVEVKIKDPTVVTYTDTMNYEYLLWYLGREQQTKTERKQFLIEEKDGIVQFKAL